MGGGATVNGGDSFNNRNQSVGRIYDEIRTDAHAFGLKDYFIAKPPNMDHKNPCILNWNNGEKLPRGRKTFLNDVIRYAKKNPSPDWRVGVCDWASSARLTQHHGHPHKDEFLKAERVTLNAEI